MVPLNIFRIVFLTSLVCTKRGRQGMILKTIHFDGSESNQFIPKEVRMIWLWLSSKITFNTIKFSKRIICYSWLEPRTCRLHSQWYWFCLLRACCYPSFLETIALRLWLFSGWIFLYSLWMNACFRHRLSLYLHCI